MRSSVLSFKKNDQAVLIKWSVLIDSCELLAMSIFQILCKCSIIILSTLVPFLRSRALTQSNSSYSYSDPKGVVTHLCLQSFECPILTIQLKLWVQHVSKHSFSSITVAVSDSRSFVTKFQWLSLKPVSSLCLLFWITRLLQYYNAHFSRKLAARTPFITSTFKLDVDVTHLPLWS